MAAATVRCMRIHGMNFRTEHSMLFWRVSAVDVSPGFQRILRPFRSTNFYKSFAQAWSCMPTIFNLQNHDLKHKINFSHLQSVSDRLQDAKRSGNVRCSLDTARAAKRCYWKRLHFYSNRSIQDRRSAGD